MPIELIDNFDNEYTFVGNDGPVFYFKTDLDAARKRLIAIDLRKPARETWKEIIPESENVLSSVSFVGNMFIADYLKDARTQVLLYTPRRGAGRRGGVARHRHGVADSAANVPIPRHSIRFQVLPFRRVSIAST